MWSTTLEVAVGLTFCYASIALIAGAAFEAGASLLKLRAGCLLDGVKALLGDPGFVGLARALYDHALVNPRGAAAGPGRAPAVLPSYIEPRHFALALIDSLQGGPGPLEDLQKQVDGMADPRLQQLLRGMVARSEGRIENVRAELAAWFDAAMDRVSGSYKRTAQLWTSLAALAVAALFNVDSLHLFRVLWDHPALMAQLAVPSGTDVAQAVQALQALPVGWDPVPASIPLAVAGWLVTASTALFGAPFWFDLLQRFVNLRGTGRKPVAGAAGS